MCICCCTTRKSILIYTIVISSFAIIYGIIAMANFASSTQIYKVLIDRLDSLENQNDYNDYLNRRLAGGSSTNNPRYYYGSTYYNNELTEDLLNSLSFQYIQNLEKGDTKNKTYGLVKSLKGIENGIGVILFIFPIIFLAAEIVFLIFIRGIKEYQVLPNNTFNALNIIKILCITISTVFIFLSIFYGAILVLTFVQYINLVPVMDSCATGIIVGMVFGYYGFWYYIILACAFCSERNKFINVGCEEKPGPEAQYDINGNVIIRSLPVVQQIIIPGQIPIMNPTMVPFQQQYTLNQQPQIYGQIQQPQIYGQYQQSQQFGQNQQPRLVEINNNDPNVQLNNVNGGKVEVNYKKIDTNDINSGRMNEKPEQK